MRAITVKQPFADMIRNGEKRLEIRSWSHAYRGPLVIHAAKKPQDRGPWGCIRCVVDLTDIEPYTRSEQVPLAGGVPLDHRRDKYAWRLENPGPLPPWQVKGRLGFWTLPDTIDAQIRRHIAATRSMRASPMPQQNAESKFAATEGSEATHAAPTGEGQQPQREVEDS